MTIDRRRVLTVGAGLGGLPLALAGASTASAGPRAFALAQAGPQPAQGPSSVAEANAREFALLPSSPDEQTAALQKAIDAAAERRQTLALPAGNFLARGLVLRPGSRIAGAGVATRLVLSDGGGTLLSAENAAGICLEDLALDGAMRPAGQDALAAFKTCTRLRLTRLEVTGAAGSGIALDACSGEVTANRIATVGTTAIFSMDGAGLRITDNEIDGAGNNGIQIWRRAQGEDGTLVSGNRIMRVFAHSGGTGENGNGINLFRAGGVIVEGNRITDCAYSAVRANAASNVQMVANSALRIAEVALYAEFGFEGALIASNLVDDAASGISVTNFDVGGRLAVVQGNLIRNLKRREYEPVDKRGDGIAVEADAAVTGNVVEGAANAGLLIGWGPHMRDVTATGNLIRGCRYGILVSADVGAGACFVSANMISRCPDGAIRGMDRGKPIGPDLARETTATARVTISGNMAV
ncbi:MAG: TIGR03808 family TAT-translocated repetitive protein [Hyphomicrobiaceae bacterium]